MTDLIATKFEQTLLDMDRLAALEQVDSWPPDIDVAEQVVVPSLERIGDAWLQGGISLAQVYLSSQICEEVLQVVIDQKQLLYQDATAQTQPKSLENDPIAVVLLEDYHALGKLLVKSALEGAGYPVVDFGSMSIPPLVERLRSEDIKILMVSALMLPSALKVKQLREAIDQTALTTKIVVGGAPYRFDPQLWQEVGADAVGQSAAEAIQVVRRLLEEVK